MKLVAQAGTCPPAAAAVVDDYTRSQDVDLQQRCLEFQAILTACPNLLPEILPVDASAEDVDVDPNLSFLDGYVTAALNNGARPYEKPEDDDDDDDNYGMANEPTTSGFNLTPYAKPQTPSTMLHLSSGMGSGQQRPANPPGVTLPPGAHHAGSGAGGTTPPPLQQPPPANIGLNVTNVANVWGRQPTPQEQQPTPTPAQAAPPSAATNAWGSSSGGGGGGVMGSSPAPAPIKTAAQLERERQAAALFGGMVPGAPAPSPPPSYGFAPASAAPPRAVVSAPPVSAPAPPPAAAAAMPEIDLLDLGAWDSSPTPAHDVPAVGATVDVFAPSTDISAAGPVVETVSEEDNSDDVGGLFSDGNGGAGVSTKAPAPAPPASAFVDDDPFASAGLLNDADTTPLPTLQRSAKFEYGGITMAPMPINTAQFGQQWGVCKSTSPVSLQSSKITALDQFMTLCADVGAHKIEAISATNEGICAGMVGAQAMALIHCKISPLRMGLAKLDVTVKCTDPQMGSALAIYLQTMIR